MKLIAACLMLFITSTVIAQADETILPYDSTTNRVTYTEVVKLDDVTAKDIYARAKFFVANAFKNANAVTMLQDDATNTIVCKGNMKAYVRQGVEAGVINFKLTIFCKDGRYKYSITDLVHSNITRQYDQSGGAIENEKPACGGLYMTKNQFNKIKSYMHGDVFLFTEDLKKQMATNASNDF